MSKYEISVWDDVYSSSSETFNEQKVIVIGSDSMTSEARAREPKLVSNIDGTNKFTFNMYYNYIDTITGEKVINPFIKYLINERKIKVLWKNEWYDLLIKQIKEDQVNHVFTYTCEDAYITELSRSGFNLTFSTDLQNNIGTAPELINKVIEDTDWQYDKNGSDTIYQETEEPVYESTVITTINAKKNPTDTSTSINKNASILVYYSCIPNLNDIVTTPKKLTTTVQFYYNGTTTWKTDENDMLVVNGDCYSIDVTWSKSGNTVIASVNTNQFFKINLNNGVSTRYRTKRYVQSQKTVYNKIVDRYVNVYNKGKLLGYNTTEFDDALSVVNLFTNASNFSNTTGWKGKGLDVELSPKFDKNTDVSKYTTTSYLFLRAKTDDNKINYIYNSGIQNNRQYIPNGFIKGDRYTLRLKIKRSGEPSLQPYVDTDKNWKPSMIVPSIRSRNANYQPTGTNYFNIDSSSKDTTNHWIIYNLTCIKSCPFDGIISTSTPFGLFIQVDQDYWLEEAQFYREVWGTDSTGKEVQIEPTQLSLQSVATTYWKYFDATQKADVTKDTLVYTQISIDEEWVGAAPVYNGYQKYGTIEISNSNRFNILQSIAETFECWVRFKIEHNPTTGEILRDSNGRLKKWIQLKKEAGQKTGIGFIYGIDLKSIVRNIKSDKISTKTIVEQNENEFGKNGFCSIARSSQNYPRENFIYNFDYYIQQGLLGKTILYNDLYNFKGYYSQLRVLNIEYSKNLDDLVNKKNELTKQTAMSKIYTQHISAIEDEITSINTSLMKLAGVTTTSKAEAYAETHVDDTKVQSLINDRAQITNDLNTQKLLKKELDSSLKALNTAITTITTRQEEIIDELTTLNKWFNIKYARFIQEGTWTSEDYWNDDLYYLDAMQVAYQSSRPQISYEINVLRLSDIEDFSSKVFKLGDISFIQDVEYFGYKDDNITPYKEQVVLTEITSYFDTPDKDVIKVQNYRNQFDDLFQRITASVQNLELNQGKYAKAANLVTSDGTIRSSVIQNTFNENKDLVYGAQNESATIDNTGITVTDNGDAAKQVRVTSGGVFVTNDGGNTWKNAIRGDGISTDLLTAGRINTEEITVYNGKSPSFRWDANGINAYKFNSSGAVDTKQFVRFDQFGIYGIKNASEVYIPTSEAQIYSDASFGLTWNKFFMKSTNDGKFIEISTDRDIVVNDGLRDRIIIGRVESNDKTNYGIRVWNNKGEIVFQCDNKGSLLSGWKLNNGYLESNPTSSNQSIKIKADGNIGCYGKDQDPKSEAVYNVAAAIDFNAINMNTNKSQPIEAKQRIFPFVSSIGKTKTQRQVGGKKSSTYMTPTADYTPTPPSEIQFWFNGVNYKITGLTWTVKLNKATAEEIETKTKDDNTIITTTYTYTFNLNAKKGSTIIFSIPYTDTFNEYKNKYIPAADATWQIDNKGNAIFHAINADGGQIAGWWIDDESIYQTYDGTKNKTKNGKNNIKTQLNSAGTAKVEGFDYSIITDAINASMASIGGVLMSSGLINGYNIAEVYNLASSALSRANDAYSVASGCSPKGHTHTFNYSGNTGYGGTPNHSHYYEGGGTTGGGN